MEITKSCIVRSVKGRDAGRLFVVYDILHENFVLLVDGKLRKVEKPKKKKLIHVEFISENNDERLRADILANEKITNSRVKKCLSRYQKPEDEIIDS